MKRYVVLLLAFVLLLLPMPAALAQEAKASGLNEPPASAAGNWYADLNGVPLQLTLAEDGTYTFASPALPNESSEGTWEQHDGLVLLDGDATSPLSLTTGAAYFGNTAEKPALEDSATQASAEDAKADSAKPALSDATESFSAAPEAELLVWTDAEIVFYRTEPGSYTPAKADSAASLESFAGYWKSAYVSLGGAPIESSILGEKTDIYIDGERVAMGGELFGDVFVNFTFSEGALKATVSDSLSIEIVLLQDGHLRMTLASPTGEMIIYLAKAPSGPITQAK
ncbi:MAG: hypothetical protein IKE43_02975 [Coriobacteriales bacterium]|nr:hypothetical protein [Coriobacteriales bacterium]